MYEYQPSNSYLRKILSLVEIDRLKEIKFLTTQRLTSSQKVVYVFHAFEGAARCVVNPLDGVRFDNVDDLAKYNTILQVFHDVILLIDL